MKNCELKKLIKENGFFFWQVAEEIGVCEMTLQRWLRSERDTSHQTIIIEALDRLKAGVSYE